MAAKPNLVKEWAQAVAKEQCQVIWDNDAVCHYFVEGGFVNWVDSWRERMDANSWCSAYAMCSKNDAYAPELAADSCTSCKNFFGNYLNIAKHNPKQFHDIFIQVTKNILSILFYWKIKVQVSSCHWNFRSEKTFVTKSTRSLDAFSQWMTQESRKWSSIN